MNTKSLISAAGLMLVLLSLGPTIAQSQPSNSGSPRVETSQKADDAKDSERKQEEVRLEAEKRKQIENERRQEADKAAREKEETRKAQEQKDRDQREQARKAEDDKRKEEARKVEETRKRDEDKRQAEARKAEDNKRKEEARKTEETRKRDEDKRQAEARQAEDDKRKEEARKSEDQKVKDREARLEAQKRKQIEREQERKREQDRVVYIPVPQPDPVVIVIPQQPEYPSNPDPVYDDPTPADVPQSYDPPVTAQAPNSSYPPQSYRRESVEPKSYVGVVFAPGSGDRKSAVGLQYLTRKFGVAAWFSGSLAQDSDVIDGTIPHNDYYTTSQVGTYGVEALCCTGSDAAMLIFGVGISVQKTLFTDVSNATGWAWDGGSETEVKPAAQIGVRLRLGGPISLQMGYDTAQSAFFGLSAGF